jgi:hypothetical protein
MDAVSSNVARSVINVSCVERLLTEHENGQDDNGFRLFNILSLGLWLNRSQVDYSAERVDGPPAEILS